MGYNDFCQECTANDVKEIKECDDKYCPFYECRRYNLDYQNERNKERHNRHPISI